MTSYVRRFADLGIGDVAVAGGKGANLGELARAGFPVPPGFVLTTAAYDAFVAAAGIGEAIVEHAALPPESRPQAYDDAAETIRELVRGGEIPDDLRGELTSAFDRLTSGGAVAVAVRSSATAEDLEGASFAGQQDTYLNIRGTAALLDAVRSCWASLWTARAMAYRARQQIDPGSVSLAVVVQVMVEATAAGVLFTANPANGRRDEALVSAAWGLGESVVSGSVTTDDLVVDKASGRIRSRTTADKTVMTVYAEAGTTEQPVPAQRRRAPVLDDSAAAALVALGVRIEHHYGAPQDIEWAHTDDGRFHIVQSRPITALPEPETEPPTEWPVPVAGSAYFRASIVEQLPDPLSPLFAGLIDGSVERSLATLFREVFGSGVLREGELGLPTINGYAYYRYSRAALWRMLVLSPAAMKVIASNGEFGGEARWRNHSHPRYERIVREWTARQLDTLPDAELFAGIGELLDAGTEYYTAVQAIIPLAASSEVIFTMFYDRLVRRAGDPPAPTFLLGFDSAPIRAEKSLYDLARWTRGHAELTATLLATPPDRVVDLLRATTAPGGDEWRARFQAHLDRFGHSTYNLDFINPVPADDPAPLFDALRFYLDGSADAKGGTDPYERQARSAARREAATAAVLARLDPTRAGLFTRLLRWAQSTAPLREDALADIGLAWPHLRRMLAELGRRRTAAGAIDRPEDVYWLRPDEAAGHVAVPDGAVAQRKALWRGQRRATPPQMLPQGTMLDRLERWMPAVSEQSGNVLRGTGASAGRITAPARMLSGPADFGRMRAGDVLVAGITTPAWTSLFAMASAVVTDIGGPLSHSSIVAREYGIPAVLGTGVATRRISDGGLLLVDGDAGTVTLLDEAGAAAPATPAATSGHRTTPSRKILTTAALTAALAAAIALWRKRRPTRVQ